MAALRTRVNAGNLMQYVNKTVILVGKCEEGQSGASLALTASDGKKVTVIRASPSSPPFGEVVEVVGTVLPSGVVQEISHTDFTATFDLAAYNEFVELSTKQFRAVFGVVP